MDVESRQESETSSIRAIARIRTEFPEKFGIPRQSGLVPSLTGRIVFEPEYRNPDALRGIEEFSHLWLIWEFSGAKRESFSATVAPPRLGGKERKGVFATRSPFRPNPLGLSSVKLEQVRWDGKDAPELLVSGADMLDGTPIFDIKPYLAYTDSHPDALGGYALAHQSDRIEVVFPEELKGGMDDATYRTVCNVLAQDPRAAYNKKSDYVYGMAFGGYDIRFVAEENVLRVCGVTAHAEGYVKIK